MSPLERTDLEAAAAASRDVARISKAQFDAFREQGFGKVEALELTKHWLSLMWTTANGSEAPEE